MSKTIDVTKVKHEDQLRIPSKSQLLEILRNDNPRDGLPFDQRLDRKSAPQGTA